MARWVDVVVHRGDAATALWELMHAWPGSNGSLDLEAGIVSFEGKSEYQVRMVLDAASIKTLAVTSRLGGTLEVERAFDFPPGA